MTTMGGEGRDGRPPRWAEWLLSRVVPSGPVGRSMVGDAREEFESWVRSGARAPRLRYVGHVLSMVAHFGLERLGLEPGRALAAARFDLKLAVRSLVRRPLFALTTVGTLALGIGATTTVFSVARGVLLRPLPYDDPEELVIVFREDPDVTGLDPEPGNIAGLYAVPYALFEDWRDQSPVLENVGAFTFVNLTVTRGDRPREIMGMMTTAGTFAALGADAELGRGFLPEDDELGAPSVAVLSHGLWMEELGGEREVLGRSIVLSGEPFTVVGVMPAGYRFPNRDVDAWVSFADEYKANPVREAGYLQVLARLRDGVNLERAEREMDALAARLAEAHPEEAGKSVVLFPVQELMVARTRGSLLMMAAAVGMVLLIACANIAGLLLVRTSERQRELAVRLAMGSDRRRLVGGFAMETAVIAGLGGLLGYGIAVFSLRPFLDAYPGGLPRSNEITVDGGMLLVALGLAGATCLLTALLPALRGSRTDVNDALRGGGRGITRGSRVQGLLVTSEVTLAVFLLVVAGLFVRSLTGLAEVDMGFRSEGVLTTRIVLPGPYRDSPERVVEFFRRLDEGVASIPGVTAVSAASQMPFSGGYSAPPVRAEGDGGYVDGIAHRSIATPGHFAALGIPVLQGRDFGPDDTSGSQRVTVINQAMAQTYWPGQDPLGKRLKINVDNDPDWYTVVGVVGDIRYGASSSPRPEFYFSQDQVPTWYRTLVVRTAGDPAAAVGPLREAIWDLEPELPVEVNVLATVMAQSDDLRRMGFTTTLFGGLSAVAVLLAILGIYGVLAYTVAQRTHEIGIHRALGAVDRALLRRVLGQGALMGVAGVALGLGLALAAGRVLESLVFQVSPSDPATLAGVAAVVMAATLFASWLPARRATRVDPMEALRGE